MKKNETGVHPKNNDLIAKNLSLTSCLRQHAYYQHHRFNIKSCI